MTQQEESQLANRQIAFLRQLPRRVEVIGRRFHRFMRDGWDINGLALIHEDSTRLAHSCEKQGLAQAQASLKTISMLLTETLQRQSLPDLALAERLQHLIEDLNASVPSPAETSVDSTTPRLQSHKGRSETPPLGYWRRWGDDAPRPVMVAAVAVPVAAPLRPLETAVPDPWGTKAIHFGSLSSSGASYGKDAPTLALEANVASYIAATTAAPAALPVAAASMGTRASVQALQNSAPQKSLKDGLRIYHLSDSGPLSVALDQRLEVEGLEIELLEDAEELNELLGALPADLVLVDASFASQLEAIGDAIRQTRARTSQRLILVAISSVDDISLRLSARRSGVDSLIVGATSADEVMRRLRLLYDTDKEAPYRILIVEDDRSQALFAEGILRNAGMESMVVLDAMQVMPALEQFQPEMILMDLHMPQASGIELTALIREHEAFLHTPIVFLSGENDADRQFDAIDAGGDDFLSKPIRPRHLISAVQGRVRRHRAMSSRSRPQESGKNAVTGLFHRNDLIERIAKTLASPQARSKGGVLFFEIDSLNLLRERLGLSALEQVLSEFSRLLGEKSQDTVTARFGDGTYFLLDETRDDAGLDSLATQLRNALAQHPFQAQDRPVRLRVSVGICALRHEFSDSGSLLNTVERVAREARTLERGVKHFEPSNNTELAREAKLTTDIRDAIADRRFELLYQPVVAVAGSDDSQYQVLLRMRDRAGKLLSAADVIPVAERTGAVLNIDRWVITEAIELIRDRQAESRVLRLFVTQSSLTLADNSHAAWLRSAIAKAGVPGSSLVIELRLEDAALHTSTLRMFCDNLIADGVQFCLSQFEAGTEAEALIELLPLGFVKLAHKYTAGSTNHVLRDELKHLINKAHRRGLEVIGHGVEDAQAAATLWMSGIDFIQGNLVQRAEQDLDFDFHQAVL